MIGNDIVDLKQSSSNWKRPRYLDKVFTKKEQLLISSAEHKHQMVWLLWSMKEAAYKIHVQQLGERFFDPKRLVCELITKDKGIVRIDSNKYFTETTITKDYVYTVAKRNQFQNIYTSIFQTENSSYGIQSNMLKQRLLKSISESKELKLESLNMEKTLTGIPQIFNNSKYLPIALSLTHCGRFSGFVYV